MGRLLPSQGYIGNISLSWVSDDLVYFWFDVTDKDGASVNPTSMGTIWVRRDNFSSLVPGSSIIIEDAISGVVGLKRGKFIASDAFYEDEADYIIYTIGATVDTENIDGVICQFSLGNRHRE